MDKNYNVDDILSEIKRKKSKGRGDSPDIGRNYVRESPSSYDETVHHAPEHSGMDNDRDIRIAPSSKKDFTFKLPDDNELAARNPLEFTGHVRPITDKAKMRQGRPLPSAVQRRGQAVKPEFTFDPDRAGVNETKVLPKFHTGKELLIEDIQNMDFGKGARIDSDFYEDYDDDIPESIRKDFSEYSSVENRNDVALDIANTKLWLFVRAAATALLTGVLFYFTLSGRYDSIPMFDFIWPIGDTIPMFIAACTLITVLLAIVNSSAMGGGLISFFKMRANSDSLAAFAVLATIAQGIAGIARPEAVDPINMTLYFSIAGLAMLFNSLGKLSLINRIRLNFRILASDREKMAVLPVENPELCDELAQSFTGRKPTVAYGVKTGFFTDFLSLSYSDKYDVGINRAVAPVCVIGSLVIGVSTFFLTNSMVSAISAFAAILCVSATFSATFIENIPLLKTAKKITPFGGMVSGSKAVEDFCDTKAVILREKDLFDGHVALRGIKAFSQGRIDDAILDAASVLCEIDGALAPLMLQMINGNRQLLKKVDNIVFEANMGVSAWVDSRRILIGNKRLMKNHGIPLPTDSYERGEAEDMPGEPIYLSNSGEVSARFLVEYSADEELAADLDYLAARDIRLVVVSSDANVNAQRIWETYGYPEELVTVLPFERHAEYKAMTKPRSSAIAEIVYTGRATAMVRSVIACVSARSSILIATIIAFVQVILGYGIIALLAFMGTIGELSITQLLIYQLFWFVSIFVVQQIRQS